MNIEAENNSDSELFNIKDIYYLLLKYKLYFVIPVILSTGIFLAYALIATPIYQADVLLTSAQSEGDSLAGLSRQYSNIASQITGINLGPGEDKSETYLAILTSRSFIEQYVVDRQIRPLLFQDLWDQDKNIWIGGIEPTAWGTYRHIIGEMITVATDRRTGLITFTVFWSDPIMAAEWANDMVAYLNSHIRKQAIDETTKSIFFLEQQLQETSKIEAQSVIYNLIEEQTKNIMLANVREEYAFKIIDPAVVPDMRSKPQRRKIVILGLLLGVVFGSLLVLVKNYYVKQIAT